MNVQEIPIESIRPYWRNSRKNEDTIPALVESIKRYGFNVPLVLDSSNTIICGHARYKAAKELLLPTVPCVVTDMDEKKAKEYRIADNKVQEKTIWDFPSLSNELKTLDNIPDFQVFFGDFSLETFLAEASGSVIPDVKPENIIKTQENMDKPVQIIEKLSVICPQCGEEFYIDKNAQA